MTTLDGGFILAGADFTVDKITFTRDAGDPIVYTDAVVLVEFYDSSSATSALLSLSSSSGSTFTNTTNNEGLQVFSMTLTAANLTTLLAGKRSNKVGYRFVLTPLGARQANPLQGSGYDGKITIRNPAFAGED